MGGGGTRARCDRCRRGRGRGNSGAAATGEMPDGSERQEERRGSPVDQHLGIPTYLYGCVSFPLHTHEL